MRLNLLINKLKLKTLIIATLSLFCIQTTIAEQKSEQPETFTAVMKTKYTFPELKVLLEKNNYKVDAEGQESLFFFRDSKFERCFIRLPKENKGLLLACLFDPVINDTFTQQDLLEWNNAFLNNDGLLSRFFLEPFPMVMTFVNWEAGVSDQQLLLRLKKLETIRSIMTVVGFHRFKENEKKK